MLTDSDNGQFSNGAEDRLEGRLKQFASRFPYPATPEFAARERQRLEDEAQGGKRAARAGRQGGRPSRSRARKAAVGLGWALAGVALLAGLLMVSPVRARVVELLRIGAVSVLLEAAKTPQASAQPAVLSDLAGETSLAQAAEEAGFALMLPKYPPDLKEPQRVYAQKINGTPVVILVWLKKDDPQEARLALYQIGEGDVFFKKMMENVEETSVNSTWALWIEGPYVLTTTDGKVEQRRMVEGHTLVWSAGGQTYRLESDLPLEETRKIAESLAEWKQ